MMLNARQLTAASILIFALTAPAEEPHDTPVTPENVIDQIGMSGLQEAFRTLRSRYIHRDQLTPTGLNRAALQGLLERLSFGASIMTGTSDAPMADANFSAATIAGDIAYLRPVTYDINEIGKIDAALEKFVTTGARKLVLDLRAQTTHVDFQIAAEILDRFLPENSAMFKTSRPGDKRPRIFLSRKTPTWTQDVTLLIDGQSGNAAETIAAVLRKERQVFIAGETTLGKTVEFEEVAIAEGITLQLAVAEMQLADGTSFFPDGITPDFIIAGDAEEKEHFFTAPADSNPNTFVFERQRARFNEASLVAGTSPELPYLIKRSAKEPYEFDTLQATDRVLQRTIDTLSTDTFLSPPTKKTSQ